MTEQDYRALAEERDLLRAEVVRLKAQLGLRSPAVETAKSRLLAICRGWWRLPEPIRSAIVAKASVLAMAIGDYASAADAATEQEAEAVKSRLAERDRYHGRTREEHDALLLVDTSGVRYCPECRRREARPSKEVAGA